MVPLSSAVIVHVPAERIVRAPVEELTVQTVEVVVPKRIVPIFAGVEVAVTECVPTDSPYVRPVGAVPNEILRFPLPTVIGCWAWLAPL